MGLLDAFRKNTAQQDAQLTQGLAPTKRSFLSGLTRALVGKDTVDDEVLDGLEALLVQSDVGVTTTVKIIHQLRARVAKDKYLNAKELDKILREEVTALLLRPSVVYELQADKALTHTAEGKKIPYVIMVVGVNGVGKTTTIGKLAFQFKQAGNTVMLGAADTFRAAAVEQLRIWSERVQVPLVQKGMGADPAAVAYEAAALGLKDGVDVVLLDTAGRLHNKVNLMNELTKIRRSLGKVVPEAPQEVLLVLDASTGQNALQQAAEFTKATQVTALALTKLDGTAKGGVVIAISDQFQIPIKYIGVGEQMNDLQLFNPEAFVAALFAE